MNKKPFHIVGPNEDQTVDEIHDEIEVLISQLRELSPNLSCLAIVVRTKDGYFSTSAINASTYDVIALSEILKDDALDKMRE